MTIRYAGRRASGNVSQLTTVPTRMSTPKNCAASTSASAAVGSPLTCCSLSAHLYSPASPDSFRRTRHRRLAPHRRRSDGFAADPLLLRRALVERDLPAPDDQEGPRRDVVVSFRAEQRRRLR